MIELFKYFGGSFSVVGLYSNFRRAFGLWCNAMGVGRAAALADERQRPVGCFSTGAQESCVKAVRGSRLGHSNHFIFVPIYGSICSQLLSKGYPIFARGDGRNLYAHPFSELNGQVSQSAACSKDEEGFTGL